jgi:hypothetical protein
MCNKQQQLVASALIIGCQHQFYAQSFCPYQDCSFGKLCLFEACPKKTAADPPLPPRTRSAEATQPLSATRNAIRHSGCQTSPAQQPSTNQATPQSKPILPHQSAAATHADGAVVTMRSPSTTSGNHPSLQIKVSVKAGPSHPHDDPGAHTTSRQINQAESRCLSLGL